MRITYLILSFTFLVGVSNLQANSGRNISSDVIKNFEQEFNGAQNINWSTTGKLNKATFTLNGQEWYAFYSTSGERVALARNLNVHALPINLLKEVRITYGQYWITSVFEVSKDGESNYYVVIENAEEKITLKSVGTAEWSKFKTISKE